MNSPKDAFLSQYVAELPAVAYTKSGVAFTPDDEVEQKKNLRCEQAETCALLEKAKTAMSEGEYGASMWVDDHTKKLERINQIIHILDDPNTPIGAVIQPSGIVPPSRLKQAIEGRLQTSSAPLFGGIIRSMADVHAILGSQITAVGDVHG
jgi:hypothetical protein